MKTKFLFIITVLVALLGINNVHAQAIAALQYDRVRPLLNPRLTDDIKMEDVDGSPLLNDQWAPGVVILADGTTYKDIPLKYNEMQDVLYFKGNNDHAYVFSKPVHEFSMQYTVENKTQRKLFKNGFTNVPNTSESSFFEILGDGSAQLIKKDDKELTDVKAYNQPVTKRLDDDSKYYLIISGKVIPFKKNKKFILSNLPGKQTAVEAFIKTNNINVKKDDDLVKLFSYYNSI